ncbi:MAG: hypothetical protein WBG11_14445, partial [Methylocella sp.]
AISRGVLDKKRREGKSEKTVSKAEWLFGLAAPALGPRRIAEITAAEVLACFGRSNPPDDWRRLGGFGRSSAKPFASPWRLAAP